MPAVAATLPHIGRICSAAERSLAVRSLVPPALVGALQ